MIAPEPIELADPTFGAGTVRAAIALGLAVPQLPAARGLADAVLPPARAATRFDDVRPGPFGTDEERTSYEAITTYNNFYEFSTDKEGPSELAKDFESRPWTLSVEGEAGKPQVWDVDELIKQFPPEERIYRLRCVEAWSMVVPWVGFQLSELIKASEPTSRAKYVRFETLVDEERMPGQRRGIFGYTLDWPYVEGLRMDEAMNPLTILGVGLYGEILPGQNGAPIRLVVPWKYGFKSIKSIVKISFVEEEPPTSWNMAIPHEYGFYSNVNPAVDHPRWSQATERRIGEFFKRDTLVLNGYPEAASLYSGELADYFWWRCC